MEAARDSRGRSFQDVSTQRHKHRPSRDQCLPVPRHWPQAPDPSRPSPRVPASKARSQPESWLRASAGCTSVSWCCMSVSWCCFPCHSHWPRVRCSLAPRCGSLPALLALSLLLLLLLLAPGAQGAAQELCFDMLTTRDAIYLQQHPMGSRAAVAEKGGKIFLMSLPIVNNRVKMDTISTYLDLSDRVMGGDETGLLSFAFHPGFARNGRFFVSYICDSGKNPDCQADLGCVPPGGCGVAASKVTTVIAEYWAGKHPLKATELSPKEVKRIITYARPHANHMGGHIFFGRGGLLYFTSGDGGGQGDPNNLAQNMQSFYGKVMRIDVNKQTKTTNYTIPRYNPFKGKGVNQMVFALGLRNPWRCDQHPRTRAIVCGDVGGAEVEEINLIVRRGNYEWSNYEGDKFMKNEKDQNKFAGMAKSPVFSYTHEDLGGMGCIIGGVFYTSRINSCLKDSYMYADHSGPIWVSRIATPTSTTQRASFKCSPGSPMKCPTPGGDGSDTEWGEVSSWSKDSVGNAYLLTSAGIFRVTAQSACGIKC